LGGTISGSYRPSLVNNYEAEATTAFQDNQFMQTIFSVGQAITLHLGWCEPEPDIHLYDAVHERAFLTYQKRTLADISDPDFYFSPAI
jgi:hypothetical protein